MNDNDRVVYCMKLWIKELKQCPQEDRYDWLIATCENEILYGKYCSDEEYNEYLITGII